jgi:hypothetical protein
MGRPKFREDVEWQIERRLAIQTLLLDMHTFLVNEKGFPYTQNDSHWNAMGRMVAAAFSLWRSAFLTNVDRERPTIYKHTIEFIEKVLEHNSITFADDHRMCELTVDYYNSNARYRMERMMTAPYLGIASIQSIYKARKEDVTSQDQRKLWDQYYFALLDSFEMFKKTFRNNSATQPRRRKKDSRSKRKSTAAGSSGRSRRSATRR